jgi:amino acid permease
MTGQILLTIIMILCFIIPLLLHYHNIVNLFKDYNLEWYDIVCTVLFIISIIYLLVTLGIFIANYWNTPIF